MEQLEKESPKSIKFICSKCGKERVLKTSKLVKNFNSESTICGYCKGKEKYKLTCQERFGVDNALKAAPVREAMTKKRALVKQASYKNFTCPLCRKTYKFKQSPLYKSKTGQTICGYCNGKEKLKQTNLQRRGVEFPAQSREVLQKRVETNLAKYGTEHSWQNQDIKEGIRQTMLARYGVENPSQSEEVKSKKKQTWLERYGVEHPWQSEEIQEKIRQTNLSRYGVEHNWQIEEVREKIKQTCLRRYNVEYPSQSAEVQAKVKQTNLAKYGVENPSQSAEVQAKVKQTNLSRYGVEYYFQSKEAQSKRKQAYRYDDVNFDSKPELAFYVYCKDHGVEIERNNQKFFTYEFGGKTHRYFPDFVVNEELIEIKGNQFLKEDSTWQNPFDRSQDATYEAKHQCAIQNKVKILYSEDYQKCIDYVLEKYGKNFFEHCKESCKAEN